MTSGKVYPEISDILIVSPFECDPVFSNSIVLIIDDYLGDYLGLILNKHATLDLSNHELIKQLSLGVCYCGGPMETDRLFVLHNVADLKGAEFISPGLFLGGDLELLLSIKERDSTVWLKCIVGYTAWDELQLESELDEGEWVFIKPNQKIIAGEGVDVWREALLFAGDKVRVFGDVYPLFPQWN